MIMSQNDYPGSERTDALISGLATQAGKRPAGGPGFTAVFPAALVISLLAAVAVVLLVAGARSDLGEILTTWTFSFKVLGMALVAAGALPSVRAAVRPGLPVHTVLCLAPGGVFLLAGAIFDRTGFPLFGLHSSAVFDCASVIVMSSVPALAAILLAMRSGTPTRLAGAGAAAGVLAGSIGALAYTVACLNDGTQFVALWYSLAIAVVTVIGAIAGPRVLAW
jgi:hypothetical protein